MDFFEELMEAVYFKMPLADKTFRAEISDRDKGKSISNQVERGRSPHVSSHLILKISSSY